MSRFEQERRDETYRYYVSEALKIIGGLNVGYLELLDKKVDDRSAEQIIDGIKEKLRR